MTHRDQIEIIRPDWHAPENIVACTTTRRGGFSQGSWGEMNLASHVGDDPDHVRQNRSLLEDSLQLPSPPVWLEQVHGCEVAVADEQDAAISCDASTTRRPGVVCAVLTADCLPLLLCKHDGSQVAAVHAGWRGLAAGIIEQTILQMGCPDEQLLAWLGPAIGPRAFEVGSEVRDTFLAHEQQAQEAFRYQDNGKWLCDIYLLARQRLIGLGVNHIGGGDLCTYTGAERFYSYRRDGATGRMASLIWMTESPG